MLVSSADVREALLRAAVAAMRPFARRLLAHGVAFGKVERRLRELFVRVAEEEMEAAGPKVTDSGIAVLTGINRKEVRRIRSGDTLIGEGPGTFSRSLAASLVSRWRSDPSAVGPSGRPLPIPYDAADGPSFVSFAKQTTADLRPRALLDALVGAGAAEERADRTVVLTRAAYTPRRGRPEILAMLADDPCELIETMLQNVLSESARPRMQQKIAFDNIGSAGLERLEAALRREADRFLERANKVMTRYDRDRNPRAPVGGRTYAGIGVYYFEEPVNEAEKAVIGDAGSQNKRGTKR